jgi:lysophospholipase L1-like esterase
MAFGDSITKGEINDGSYLDGSEKCEPGPERAPLLAPLAVQPEFAYPSVVDHLLTARYRKQSITMLNEGVARTRATEDTERFAERVAADRPDAVLLLQGILDVYNGVSPASALGADIRNAKARGAKAVFVSTLLPLSLGAQTCGVTNESVREANDDIRATAQSEGAVLVDAYSAFIGRLNTLMGPDGLHPTAEGQEVIAHLFYDAIKAKFEVAPGTTSGAAPTSELSPAHVQVRPPPYR